MHTIVSSATKTVTIGADQPFCIIGERINPTGRKIFQEQLRAGDLSAVEKDECCMKTLQQALTVVCCASAVAAIGVDPP